MLAKDGTPMGLASYAFPQVRDFMVSLIEEGMQYDIDGVNICLIRGPEYFGYEKPVIDDFMKLYELHREMYMMARNELRPGNIKSEIDAKVRDYAMSKMKFSFASPVFRGMSAIVDPPYRVALSPGQVFMIHPWTNPPEPDLSAGKGHMGHIIGDTCIVTEGEAESVSKLPLELTIV